MGPKFSIVVPTRNRSATLRHTLQTCLDQTFGNFEVVVSDNFSSDDTAAVVAALGDPRIRYVRTSSYISMSRNFANGLKHARGDAIIFIGDDDGMLPFGLELLNRIFADNPETDAVRWHPPFFWWPGGRDFELRVAGSDFNRRRAYEYPEAIRQRVTHPDILNFFEMTGFTIYHGCWRRRVVERAQEAGLDVFNGPIPDVLASIFGLHYANSCIVLETPASIMGVSKKSNGWAQSAVKPSEDQKEIRDDFSARSAADFPDTPPITYVYCANAPYYGSLLTYWLRTHGSLAEFDHEAWRLIFLDQAVTLYADDAEGLCASYNAFVPWLIDHGAKGAREITAADRKEHIGGGRHMPAAKAPQAAPHPGLWSVLTAPQPATPGVAIRGAHKSGAEYVLNARTNGPEFTISDFAQLYANLFCVGREWTATYAECDPSSLNRLAIASLEGRRNALARTMQSVMRLLN